MIHYTSSIIIITARVVVRGWGAAPRCAFLAKRAKHRHAFAAGNGRIRVIRWATYGAALVMPGRGQANVRRLV